MSASPITPPSQAIDYAATVKSDDNHRARMRFHQSWFRHHVLNELPGQYNDEPLGNRLSPEAGDTGANFLHSEAFEAAKRRYPGPRKARLWTNLLTSEALCFNLFGPLVNNPTLAAAAFKDCGLPVCKVTRIEFEQAPQPKQDYLDDNTAFDAFIEFEDSEGRLCFLGVETKLTEPFSPKGPDFKIGYSKWQASQYWCWSPKAVSHFMEKEINQLWRNQLLCVALLENDQPRYHQGWSIVIAPKEDQTVSDSVTAYKQHLISGAPFQFLDIEKVWTALWCNASKLEDKIWLRLFRLRYLDLTASDLAWRSREK